MRITSRRRILRKGSELDEGLFRKLKEVCSGKIGTLNFSVSLIGGLNFHKFWDTRKNPSIKARTESV